MVGVLVNCAAIIAGGLVGLLLKNGINEKVKKVIMQGIGLSVIVIGLSSALLTESMLLMVLSLVSGGIIGALLKVEDNLDRLGKSIEDKLGSEGGFAKGFVWATLLYCVGAMSITGSLNAGLQGDNTVLFIKSILDGVTAIVFTATMGYGVIFSSISVFLFQGAVVLLGFQIEPYITDEMINEISAVGGVLILGIGLNLLEIKKIHIGDLLPSIFIPPLYMIIISLFS